MTGARKSREIEEIGQLLIVGFDGLEMTARISSLLSRLQPAGVILFARNIKSPEQTWRLLRECQKCVATPLFTCIDLEGGTVDRFRDALGAAPSAADVFADRQPQALSQTRPNHWRELSLYGIQCGLRARARFGV